MTWWWALCFEPKGVKGDSQCTDLRQICGQCIVSCFSPFWLLCCLWSIAPLGCGDTRCHWYLFTDLPLHISPSSRRVSACLLQEHSVASTSISSLCALLLLNDVMSCFSQFIIRHTRWEMDIPCPNGIILLALSRTPDKPSLLVALFGKQESKECGQHWKKILF